MAAVMPGSTIGILGGGQLGRMAAMAARSLGYRIHVLDPDPRCAARFVVERCITAPFDDVEAAATLARDCQVVTLEIEKVSTLALDAAARFAPVRPASSVLGVIQDRAVQKDWLATHGYPVGPYRVADSADALTDALTRLRGRCFVKAARGGYDGRGQFETTDSAQAAEAWRELAAESVVAEAALSIEAELSVLVARRPSGEIVAYPPALNQHEHRVLAWSAIPGPMPPAIARQAVDIARAVANDMAIEGLLVVELFLLRDGHLLVNELAPRPHNSFHATEVACPTSQFEQMIRAVCDLPLGAVEPVRPAAIMNLLGDLWLEGGSPAFDRALGVPGVRVHLYGKSGAKPGRKMGHLSAIGTSPEDAVARVREAFARLTTSGSNATA